MSKKLSWYIFKAVRGLIWLFYPKTTAEGIENIPNEPSLIIGNHTQMNGPIVCEIYFPKEKNYTWCAGGMMHLKDVPNYAYTDFWSQKPKLIRPFYKLLSYIIAPLSVCIFNNARTIGVYHDARLLSTFRNTIKRLNEGNHVVIFPEKNQEYNNIIYNFEDKFVDVAKMYYKKTGKCVAFVPLYIAPKLKKMYFGKPIYYNPDISMEEQRKLITNYLMEEITAIAKALPKHTVVPYRNIPKKYYPSNKAGENNEKTCC